MGTDNNQPFELSLEWARQVKKRYRKVMPNVKSQTMSEAIARGFGYRTHAALLAALTNGPVDGTWDQDAFTARLDELQARHEERLAEVTHGR